MQSVWYSIKVIAVQKLPEALDLIAICSVVGFQNTELMVGNLSAGTAN